ncbi:MAG: hypothetical protein ABSF33_14405 [Acidimicrobiales bacterium]|jgi:hypothetical protein
MTATPQAHRPGRSAPGQVVAALVLAAGVLVCACGGGSSASTGVLKGTATPCIPRSLDNVSRAWEVEVVLRRGPTVIAKKAVLDTKAAGERVIDELFTFTEPPGSYSISGVTPKEQPVAIKAGTTSIVELTGLCRS